MALTDPKTGRPLQLIREEENEKRERLERERIAESERFITAINSEPGKLFIESLLDDYAGFLGSLSAETPENQGKKIAVMEYISGKLTSMGMKSRLSQIFRDKLLENTVGQINRNIQ